MIHRHPVRVLGVTFLIGLALFLLAAPGADDTQGAWYYISAFGWYGFMLTAVIFVVLAVIALVSAVGRRRRSPSKA
jgi:membrane protein YdbS with pleckstrin-like domain